MGLNIKNEHVHELARRAARLTGQSQTGAIELALSRLLESLGDDPQLARRDRLRHEVDLVLRELDLEVARTTPGAIASPDDLYDSETGLPR